MRKCYALLHGAQRIIINGEEVGMTDDGYARIGYVIGDVKMGGGSFTCSVSVRKPYYVHDHDPLGKHRHELLGGGRFGPAERVR